MLFLFNLPAVDVQLLSITVQETAQQEGWERGIFIAKQPLRGEKPVARGTSVNAAGFRPSFIPFPEQGHLFRNPQSIRDSENEEDVAKNITALKSLILPIPVMRGA